jgi:hypothetical protein
MGTVVLPIETNSPLSIDANAVLPSAVSLQGLQLITRWDLQAVQFCGGVYLQELSPSHTFNVLEPGHHQTFKKCLSILTVERMNHA